MRLVSLGRGVCRRKLAKDREQSQTIGPWLYFGTLMRDAHSVGSASSWAAVLFSERSRSAHPASTGANRVAFADASSSLPARHAECL